MKRLDVWYQRSIAGTPRINSIAFGNGTYMAVGEGIYTSNDGVTWAQSKQAIQGEDIYDVTFDGTYFVAIIARIDDTGPYIFSYISSDNGKTWTRGVTSPATCFASAIASSQRACVAAGESLQTSNDDGMHWQETMRHQSGASFSDICVGKDTNGGDLFVAVGISNNSSNMQGLYSATSTDGSNWSYLLAGAGMGGLVSVAYGKKVFVAIGEKRHIYMSLDGLTWTRRSFQPADDLYKITFAQDTFVAVGRNGNVYDSADGDHWNVRNVGTTVSLREVHFCGNTFIVVADENSLYQSERYDQPFLGITFDGYGSVEIQPGGMRPTKNWGATFPMGTDLTLTAHGEHFYTWIRDPLGHLHRIISPIFTVFDGWTGLHPGSGLAGQLVRDKHNPIELKMDQDKNLMAHFQIFRPKPPRL